MTQDRRITDKLPAQPLDWSDTSSTLIAAALVHLDAERIEGCFLPVPDTNPALHVAAGPAAWIATHAASQSQAVPSELASLTRYDMVQCVGSLNEYLGEVKDGEYVKLSDVQSLFSHSAATGKVPASVLDLPGAIMNLPCKRARDDFASLMEFMTYKEGCRDARHAAADLVLERADELAALASPAAPLAGKAEPVAREDQGRKAETAYPSQVRQALTLAMAICDAVPSRAHEAPEDDPLRSIGKLVNYQEDTGLHGYAVIRDALEAIARDTAPLAAAVPAEEASKERNQ